MYENKLSTTCLLFMVQLRKRTNVSLVFVLVRQQPAACFWEVIQKVYHKQYYIRSIENTYFKDNLNCFSDYVSICLPVMFVQYFLTVMGSDVAFNFP